MPTTRYLFDIRFDDQPWSEDDTEDDFDSAERAREEAVALRPRFWPTGSTRTGRSQCGSGTTNPNLC